jgi:hypothetical protein
VLRTAPVVGAASGDVRSRTVGSAAPGEALLVHCGRLSAEKRPQRSLAAAEGEGAEYADAVTELLSRPEEQRRRAARLRAECFPWSAAVAGFLSAHRTVH